MDDPLLRPLLLTPPAEFVAARNALAKSLKAEGRRDDATRIAAIRRPTWTDWALNTAVDAEPDLGNTFAEAADAMREAQAAAVEGRPADVAGALRALRVRTTAMAKGASAALGRAGRPPDIAELTERLAAVAADTTATVQLRAGMLRAGDGDNDAIAGLPDAATTVSPHVSPAPAPRPTARGKRAAQAPGDQASVDPAGVDPGTAERAAERRRLMREIADLERAQRTTAHELARAERAVDEATTKRATAEIAVARAQDELRDADQRLAHATERRDALDRDAEQAEQRAIVLRAELDRLAVDVSD